ncbi:MAG: glycosyltransferase [Verrucomicrobiales bacterium]|nr:glycosyltransferase [Verrucomicrobiales bacterium]
MIEKTSAPIPVLVVSYIFPPVGEVGAKRIGKFCRYFPETGIRPIVLTAQERFYKFQDRSVPPPDGIRIERTAVWPTPLDLYKKLRRGRDSSNSSSASAENGLARHETPGGLLKRHLIALLQTPDQYWGWYMPAVREGRRLIQEEGVEAILSTGPPWISHLVALHLKRKYRVPWLADFRDPWGYDPFTGNFIGWQQKLKEQMEAKCVRSADRVICNTDRLRMFFRKTYPNLLDEKFLHLPNGFDESAPPAPSIQAKGERRLFLHIGSLYAQRRVDTFCRAVSGLVQSGKLPPGSFRVVFLGDTDRRIAAAARESAPELFADGSIEFRPRVSWHEAQELLWQADYLLLFQGHLRLEVPAKFFEYLPTGKPMLASVKEGALTDIVEATGCGVHADPDDSGEIAASLERLLTWPVLSPEQSQRKWHEHYHYRSLTGQLADWIQALAKPSEQAADRR